MNKVIKILMDRDGLTEEEARDLVETTREELNEGCFDAIQVNLGLEDDYLFDIIG